MSDDSTAVSHGAALPAAADHRSSLWMLLGSLLVLQFGYPITTKGDWWTVLYLCAYSGVIAYGVRAVRPNPRRNWPIGIAALALIGGGTWFALAQSSDTATSAMLAGVGLLQLAQLALLVTLVSRLLRPPSGTSTVDLLLVAVSAYLLMGGVFGVAAGLIEIHSPGSFADTAAPGAPVPWQTLFYGSYVTLATLGYGDVTPVTDWPRALWSFEAVIGTLFLAVFIARLVGVAGFVARDQRNR